MRVKERIADALRRSGAIAWGAVRAEAVDGKVSTAYDRWLAQGCAAGMEYLGRYGKVRRDPRLLLDCGARTIISTAFSFVPEPGTDARAGHVACYAFGEDYHDAIRHRLTAAAEEIHTPHYGPETARLKPAERPWRVCVDTAPVHERYWAVKAGVGRRARNGMVMVEGAGPMAFLAEIVTALPIEDIAEGIEEEGSVASAISCIDCGACLRACPGGAMGTDGTLDARRCLSYLTIEHKGNFPESASEIFKTKEGRGILFGCDTCLRVCPLAADAKPTSIVELKMTPALKKLTAADITQLDPESFREHFRHSPLKRAGLDGLRRNLRLYGSLK